MGFSRFVVVAVFILIATGNITNSLLMKFGFEDQPAHAIKHATFSEIMNGTAARPFVYRATLARLDKLASQEVLKRWPSFPATAQVQHLHHVYFSDVKGTHWTPELATAYTLMYFMIVLSTAVGLLFVWKLARLRGLAYTQATGFMVAFSFIFPLFFQRSVLFYDFAEFAGVFGAVYFFLEDRLIICTLWIAAFAFVKETFFLAPFGLFFLHRDGTPIKKRLRWAIVQLALCCVARYFIMRGCGHNAGWIIEFHFWENIAFWLSPKYWLGFNNLIGPGIFLPQLENPLFLIPIGLFSRSAWKSSDPRWRRYFLAAFLPLLALFIPFGFADMFRNFSLAFPAMTLISLSFVSKMSGDSGQRGAYCER